MRDEPGAAIADVLRRRSLAEPAAAYCRSLVACSLEKQSLIDEIVSATLHRWKLDRLSFVDRAVLRMACCELLFFADVPATVSINEAVELAKLYGDDRSAQFVNGVLDAIARKHPKPDSGTSARDRTQEARKPEA